MILVELVATLLLAAKILLITCSAFVASVFLYAWAANTWEARELRRWAQKLHEGRQRRAAEAKARHETRAIPTDRNHPLHTLGGRFQ
jgi:hypothetical protein